MPESQTNHMCVNACVHAHTYTCTHKPTHMHTQAHMHTAPATLFFIPNAILHYLGSRQEQVGVWI